MITQAIVAHQTGGPEVFALEEVALRPPAADEVLIEHRAIGVNFIDTYFRKGLYPWTEKMPIIAGAEASGVVLETGASVTDWKVGDRVAYTVANGAYCRHRLIRADRLVRLPDDISFELAAASMLKGLTVHYLLHRSFQVRPGHGVLFHAAAGGVGLLAGQWASQLGATVIGTVSTEEKAALARQNGYTHTINYVKEHFVEKVMEITGGEGVEVVYDSVGQDTYPYSLECLKRLGYWVCFGQSSGVIRNFQLGDLARHGSLFATRPRLFDYIATRQELTEAAEALFGALRSFLQVQIHQRFRLEEAAEVHRLLEGRKTVGSTILLP